ncbi:MULTISPECIES: response regulator [Galbibacter]|uniref:Response regulator transcription factor n=1 Tax=Galbibacter pacificus TaxID=2996052 RepID=A0ABT6FRV6_9FLAO|nr:response regulator transcription factor [Galbibacter pacificus]MDG3582873.1 response regulator transcription factor [Galbibacter pacificus]MDG3586008.1 response regulator transcription factor [Galbibacter pacificus]
MKEVKILIVDDHPMIVEGYKNAIENMDGGDYIFKIDIADSCDTGLHKIKKASVSIGYDIILLDIKLPPSKDGKIVSGEDLALRAKRLLPEAKIAILTMFNNNYRIYNILKNIDPEGLLIKSDVDSEEIITAVKTILERPPYYSHTVNRHLRTQISNDFLLDDFDRGILFHISKGVKTKDLPNYVPLSLAAIEKRKKNLKIIFDVSSAGDQALIERSRENGFI